MTAKASSWGSTDNRLQLLVGAVGGGNNAGSSTTNPGDGWRFVAAVYENDGANVNLFIGEAGDAGKLKAPQRRMPKTTSVIGGEESLFVGRRPGSDPRVFPGDIDNVRIYDRALDLTELNTVSSFNDVVIPEPASLALIGVGGMLLLGRRQRAARVA